MFQSWEACNKEFIFLPEMIKRRRLNYASNPSACISNKVKKWKLQNKADESETMSSFSECTPYVILISAEATHTD